MRRSTKLLSALFLGTALALAFAPLEADAAPPIAGGKGKRFRLSVDTEFFGWTHFNPDENDPGDPEEPNTNVIGFGVNRWSLIDTPGDAGGIYVGRPLANIGLGYVFAQERAIVGGRFGFAMENIPDNGEDDMSQDSITGASGMLAPYFRWVFLPGTWARPYVEGRLGMVGTSGRSVNRPDAGGQITNTVDVLGPVFGVGGGVHLFPTEYFSVDIGLNYDLRAPHVKSLSRIENEMGDTLEDREGWRRTSIINGLGILVGISVWL
jgi:opacity protein-like surface antigen